MEPSELEARLRAATPAHTVRPWPLPIAVSPRIEALRARLEGVANAHGDDVAAALARIEREFAEELRAEGTPIFEPDGTDDALVTFVWIGDAPHGVLLQLNRFTDVLDPADTRLSSIAASRIHAMTLRLPRTWLGGYGFVPLPEPLPAPTLHRGADRRALGPLLAAMTTDPFAREHAPNKTAPRAQPPTQSQRQSQPQSATPRAAAALAVGRADLASARALWRDDPAPTESLGALASHATGEPLPLSRWSHPVAGPGSPTLLFADGEVWREQFPIAPELRRRIDAGQVPPVHALFLESGGPRQRQFDYAGDAIETSRLLDDVIAAARPVVGDGPLIVAGQSLGGLFAMLCATRHPERVAAVIAQSPSLWWPSSATRPGSAPSVPGPGWFDERAAAIETSPDRRGGSPVLVQGGTLEWGLAERFRDAAALLRAERSLVGFDEVFGGHDVVWWQALLPDAISRTFAHLGLGDPGTRAATEGAAASAAAGAR